MIACINLAAPQPRDHIATDAMRQLCRDTGIAGAQLAQQTAQTNKLRVDNRANPQPPADPPALLPRAALEICHGAQDGLGLGDNRRTLCRNL